MDKAQWIVDAKGEPNRESWEISVVRSDNRHGIASFGWFDDRKIYISGSGGPCREKVSSAIWNKLLRCAEEVAADLNAK